MPSRIVLAILAIGAALAAVALGVPPAVPLFAVTALLFALLYLADRDNRPTLDNFSGSGEAGSNKSPASRAASKIVEAIDNPAILLDGQLDVRAFNSAARNLFPQLRHGGPLSPHVRNPELLNAVKLAIGKTDGTNVEIVARSPTERRLLAVLTPVKIGEANHSASLLLQLRDLTDQDRLAQMRSDFIANASHELRTPLASLRGFIETLRGAAKDDRAAREKFLAIMEQQATRMSRIIDDLLSLSRIEMRSHLLPEATVDLAQCVASVVHGLEPLAQNARMDVNFFSPAGLRFDVRGDKDELVQVFQNIIENAIKYGNAGGNIEISLERVAAKGSRPERVLVKISDDGPGIAEEHLPRLTERFYRVDTALSRERGGTGLGLAIVKHILARHRGDLEIRSEVGKGSPFTVILNAAVPVRVTASQPNSL